MANGLLSVKAVYWRHINFILYLGLISPVSVVVSGMDNGRVSGMDSGCASRAKTETNRVSLGLRRAIWVIRMRRAWLLELSDSIREYIRAAERLELAGTLFVRPGYGLRQANLVDLTDLDDDCLSA